MPNQLQRQDVPAHEKWNLADIYPSPAAWDEDYAKIETLITTVKAFENQLTASGSLLAFLRSQEEMYRLYEKLYVYASLQLAQDTRETSSQALLDKASQLGVRVSASTAFFSPFLMSLDPEVLEGYIKEEEGLRYYERDLYEEYKYKKHVLSQEKEEVLSQLGEVIGAPRTIFNMLNNADIRFGKVHNEEGDEVPLTRGMYAKIMEHQDRSKREEAFYAFNKPYLELKNTIAATLGSSVKNNVLFSRMRGYESPLQRSLFKDDVPVSVYDNLLEATKANLAPLHHYLRVRKKALGVEDLRVYDLSVPLVTDVEMTIPYEEAYDTMLAALAPLGDEYVSVLAGARTSGWIDVRETEGKRSGAFCSGPYGTHPYVLLNHNNTFDSMFTLAHEMGHAMHSYYSDKHQPAISAQYTIFVAEVASTVNEVLLMKHYLKQNPSASLKKYLLNHFIDEFRGTYFTQVMFAEFEKRVHEKAMRGETLNSDSLSEVYEDLYKTYYGDALELNPEVKYGWARIPHFYNAFYVYKYATGYASAFHLASRIFDGDTDTVRTYLEFLKSGRSEYPLELLRRTGVDLLQPEPIQGAMEAFAGIVKEFESTF
ncbi:oligoendopeptidase F [Paenibacillus mucilaginosus]|uniref:oligoendopeptidase F n=1 Tax=Paenibacillus mucilaginosus TaxID=61624 RepID=UPI003D25077B